MPDTNRESEAGRGSLGDLIRGHPVVTALIVSLAVLGAVLGGLYLPPEWPILRRVAAGALSGAGVGFFVVATRLIG